MKFNLDKLEIALKHNADFENKLISLNECNSGRRINDYIFTKGSTTFTNSAYRYNFIVNTDYAEEDNLFDLYWDTYLMKREYIYIRITNQTLYNPYFWEILNDFLHTFNLEIEHISKLDICADTEKNIIKTIERKMKDKDIIWVINNRKIKDRKKTVKGGMWIENLVLEGKGTKTLLIKQREGMTLCLYDKTKEITDKGNTKDYIINQDSDNTKKLYRSEIRMNRKNIIDLCKKLKTNDMIMFELIQDEESLAGLFDIQTKSICHWWEDKTIKSIKDII